MALTDFTPESMPYIYEVNKQNKDVGVELNDQQEVCGNYQHANFHAMRKKEREMIRRSEGSSDHGRAPNTIIRSTSDK